MDKKIGKRGQITLWVIIAVVMVATIILFFMLGREPESGGPIVDSSFDVESYLDVCTKNYVEEAVDIMLPQGGFINPGNSVFFNNTNIEYICKNIGNYEPCIQQHPMLMNEMKEEIRNYVLPQVNNCLGDMKREFERRGNVVSMSGPTTLEVDFGPDRIFLTVGKRITIEKEGEVRTFDELEIEIESPVHNLADVAMEIARQEAGLSEETGCYFEFVGYSILHPRYKISKYVMSDPTKIYTIRDTKSEKEMNIAIRSCAIPPGF